MIGSIVYHDNRIQRQTRNNFSAKYVVIPEIKIMIYKQPKIKKRITVLNFYLDIIYSQNVSVHIHN